MSEGGQIAVSVLSVLWTVSVPLCCRLSEALNLLSSHQVFDATNTTRERRDLILAFGKENAFKVKARSYLFVWLFMCLSS